MLCSKIPITNLHTNKTTLIMTKIAIKVTDPSNTKNDKHYKRMSLNIYPSHHFI